MDSTSGRNAGELLAAYAEGRRDFSGWTVSGGVLLRETFEGCVFDGSKFRECAGAFSAFVNCSLVGSDFTHCVFNGVDFLSSSLDECSFTQCILDRGDYFMSTMRGARVVSSSMRNSCFVRANLADAKLERTNLNGSIFGKTTLSAHMLLFGTSLEDTVVVLPHVISPAELKQLHQMAYVLSMMTNAPARDPDASSENRSLDPKIARALCGQIPGIVEFLERGGVPSDQLVPLKNVISLTAPRSPGSVFLSYATEDEGFAHELAKILTRSGLEVWFAPRTMRGGQKLYDQLMREIDARDRLVLIVSKAAMNSAWVQTELRRALRSDNRATKRRVVPVLLVEEEEWRSWTLVDSDSGRDLALQLRTGPTYSFTSSAGQSERVAETVRALLAELVEAGTGKAS